MEEILHQLRLVVHPIIYRVLYISGGCLGFLPSTFFLGQLDSVTQARSNKASWVEIIPKVSTKLGVRSGEGCERCLPERNTYMAIVFQSYLLKRYFSRKSTSRLKWCEIHCATNFNPETQQFLLGHCYENNYYYFIREVPILWYQHRFPLINIVPLMFGGNLCGEMFLESTEPTYTSYIYTLYHIMP